MRNIITIPARVYLFSFVVLCAFSTCKKDDLSPEQSEFFLKFFGSSTNDVGYDVKQTEDGGYILFGTMTQSPGNTDMCLIKTDKYGNKEWTKTYGDTANDEGRSIQILPSGGFALLGSLTVGATKQMYLVKVDKDGSKIWAKDFGKVESDEVGNSLQIASNGDYVLVGYSTQKIDSIDPNNQGNPLGKKNIYIVKTDEGQNFVERNYGYKTEDEGNSVQQVPSTGEFVMAGSTQFGGLDYNFIFEKVSSDVDASPLNSPNFGGTGDQFGEALQILPDETFVMVGTSNKDIYVAKIAPDLQNKAWEKTFGGTGSDLGKDIKQTKDGGFIVLGSKRGDAGDANIYLIKLDAGGEKEWEYTYGSTGDEYGEAIDQTEDEGYIVIGSSGTIGNQTICLLKVTADGKLSK